MHEVGRLAAMLGPGQLYVFVEKKWSGAERGRHVPGGAADVGDVIGDLYEIEFDDGSLRWEVNPDLNRSIGQIELPTPCG